MLNNFINELKKHNLVGYHIKYKYDFDKWTNEFQMKGWSPPAEYLEFLEVVGPGRYFDGAFNIFDLSTMMQYTEQIELDGEKSLFAIGYEGTTDGCFCLSKQGKNDTVYWFSWENGEAKIVFAHFSDWISQIPDQYFIKKVYQAFKPVKDIDCILSVINERRKIDIKIINFNKELVRTPEKPNDFLPRYHLVKLGVTIREKINIEQLTVKLLRSGSTLGEKNVWFTTINLSKFSPGYKEVETYLFDPFNLPFDKIVSLYSPEIDLGKSRVHYKEISKCL